MRRCLCAALAAFALGVAIAGAALAQQAPSESSTPVPAGKPDEFGERVRAYLLANPEVVIEAAQRYQERQQVAQAETVRQTIASKEADILRDPTAPVGGNKAGDVAVVEFFDYNCKYCRAVASTLTEVLRADPELRLVYKEFPILGPGSEAAAKVALAAARQGKYDQVHQALMTIAPPVTEETALKAAAATGLDLDRLKREMSDPAIAESIASNHALAAELAINGTPAFVIGDELVPGAVDKGTLEGLITKARGSKPAKP